MDGSWKLERGLLEAGEVGLLEDGDGSWKLGSGAVGRWRWKLEAGEWGCLKLYRLGIVLIYAVVQLILMRCK